MNSSSRVRIVDRPPSHKEAVHIWVDGACVGNPGPMGIGIVKADPLASGQDSAQLEVSEYLGKGTNNIAELTAILRGLDGLDPSRPVVIYTDSSYAIGVLAGGYRAKANQALIADTRKRISDFQDVYFVKVAGHAGIEGNERADALARAAATRRPAPSRAAASAPTPAALPVPAGPSAELARRIERALRSREEGAEPSADREAIAEKYRALKSAGHSFGDAAVAARTEWIEQVIAEHLAQRFQPIGTSLDGVFMCLWSENPVAAEAHARRAYRVVIGSDEFNDGWLAAYEKGPGALDAYCSERVRRDQAGEG